MVNICVVGTGYVGLVTGTLLANFGNSVICVDVDENKINGLRKGICPIYEPNLSELIETNMRSRRLTFTTDISQAIQCSEVVFIAVGTPSEDDGSADLTYVLNVARDIGTYMNAHKIVVDKSTVPVGTGALVRSTIQAILDQRNEKITFDIVSNPEFLREGSAVYDFTHPDRVVLGTESAYALERMKEIYDVLYKLETPFVETNIETAEMIKYASNAFLALKISFINEMSVLCDKIGANVQQVATAMGRDGRISPKFLHAGAGFGGSCFPKDTRALCHIGQECGVEIMTVEAAIRANERQKRYMVQKICEKMGDLHGKSIAILGLTFKAGTDDMRDAPSLTILPELVKCGAKLRAYDPQGEKEAAWRLEGIADSLTYAEDEYSCTEGANAVVFLTDWPSFLALDLNRVKKCMNGDMFFDLRNMYKRVLVEKHGFTYIGVGV